MENRRSHECEGLNQTPKEEPKGTSPFFHVHEQIGVESSERGEQLMDNGEDCNGEESVLQMFLYRVKNPDDAKTSGFTYFQQKIEEFESYVPAPYSNVPPGDCLIIEMGPKKDKTDRICETFRLAIERGDISGG